MYLSERISLFLNSLDTIGPHAITVEGGGAPVRFLLTTNKP